jgi:signal transduction histidine kinase
MQYIMQHSRQNNTGEMSYTEMILDRWYWMDGTGCYMPEAGSWELDAGSWKLGAGIQENMHMHVHVHMYMFMFIFILMFSPLCL